MAYCCPCPECFRTPLRPDEGGLSCPQGHHYPYVPGSRIPVFAKSNDDSNEYSTNNAAEIHDNSLRWVFSTFGVGEAEFRERLIARLQLTAGQKLLVTGAGAGNDLPYLAQRLGQGGEIHAIDIAQQMLVAGAERHREGVEANGVAISFAVGDATRLPYADKYFDAAYHFGGINLFSNIRQGIAEMARVVRIGGTVVFGDEGLAPWLRNTEYGRMLITNNPLYACDIPLDALPESARDVHVGWELGNCFYVVDFTLDQGPPPIDIDVPHVGIRGGSIRSRYFGQLEGVAPSLRDRLYAEAQRQGVSRVALLERLLESELPLD